MDCTYSLWQVAITHSFCFGIGFGIICYALYSCKPKCKDENGKVNRGKNGRFVSRKK